MTAEPMTAPRRYRTIAEFRELFPFLTERWIKDRLQPGHPERIQHHRYGNERVFHDEDITWFENQHLVPGAEVPDEATAADAPSPLASVTDLPIDPKLAAFGRKALGLASGE